MSIVDGIRSVRDDGRAEVGVDRVHLFWTPAEGERRLITSQDFVDQVSQGILFPADEFALSPG